MLTEHLQGLCPHLIGCPWKRSKISQAVFAAVLNTSLSTVRQWEIGDKRPSGPSLKLLDLLDRNGLEALL